MEGKREAAKSTVPRHELSRARSFLRNEKRESRRTRRGRKAAGAASGSDVKQLHRNQANCWPSKPAKIVASRHLIPAETLVQSEFVVILNSRVEYEFPHEFRSPTNIRGRRRESKTLPRVTPVVCSTCIFCRTKCVDHDLADSIRWDVKRHSGRALMTTWCGPRSPSSLDKVTRSWASPA